jgi:hypothetical protein
MMGFEIDTCYLFGVNSRQHFGLNDCNCNKLNGTYMKLLFTLQQLKKGAYLFRS